MFHWKIKYWNFSIYLSKIKMRKKKNIKTETAEAQTSCHTTKSNSKVSEIEKNSCIEGIASWRDDNAVKMLIHLWKEYEWKFKSSKFRKDTVWKEISDKLREANDNWHYTATQCENKWKDLRKTYVKVKDHNNTSGNNPKTCKFYDDIDDILSDKPCITPISIASNLRKRPMSINDNVNCMDSEDYDLLCDPAELGKEVQTVTQQRKKPRIQSDVAEWNGKREEARERRHKEMLNQSKEAINTMKEVMLKLIEKL